MQEQNQRTDWQLWAGLLIAAVLMFNVGVTWSLHKQANAAFDPFGNLKVTLLTTPECPECFDLQPLREYLTQNGVEDAQITEVAYDSRAGQKLIKKYAIAKVPTALIPESIVGLDFMKGVAENLGVVNNGALVITELQPPYVDLATKEVVGRFDVTILTDETCTECYDPSLHDDVLGRMAMTPSKRTLVDISSEEGKALVESYFITSVPTILLRGDLSPYTDLQDIWSSVGTKEDDGTFVLRQGVANMGAYRRLTDGVIVQPETTTPPTP